MAAAKDDAPVVQMEGYLKCSICLETLQDARTLGCFHSFCKSCLEKFVKIQREKAEGEVIEIFNCPDCRTEFILRRGEEVEGMTRNHFIRNMLELLKIRQRQANEIPCTSCKLKPPAVSRCTTCDEYLCTECLTAHKNWPAFEKHAVFTIDELAKPENQGKIRGKLKCKKHKDETLQYYCETCKKLGCIHCILSEHNKDGHSYASVEEVAEKKRELLMSSSGFLNDQLKEGNDALQDIEHVTQKLQKNTKKAKDEISQQKQNILKAFTEKLEENAKIKMNEVDNNYNETHECLVKQKVKMKAYVDKVKGSLELTKHLLDKGTPEEILSSFQNGIEENVKQVKKERPTRMKPVHDGNIEYKANPVNNIDTTSNLDKMGEVVASVPVNPDNFPNTSTILNGHNEYVKQVVEWLGDQFQWRLCYQASQHGWRAKDFHRTCDNKGPTVTLVRVGDYIFGGYTDQNWEGQLYKQSNSSFLFSLKNKDNLPPFKAPVKNPQHAIHNNPSYGPTFGGGHDLHICNNAHTNQQSYTNFGHTYQLPEGYLNVIQRTLLAGSRNFTPNEIEVFY